MDAKLLLIATLACIALCDSSNSVVRIGNQIRASLSGVDVPGAIFLQRDIVLTDGVAFAFSAYFRSHKPVRFQIWRPENITDVKPVTDHRLIAETRVTPSVLGREDVYIESRLTDKCIRVRSGDRIGILLEESPGAVAYIFDDQTPTTLGNRLENTSDPYAVDDVVSFDALLFPYDFSVAAHVDTDASHYAGVDPDADLVDCFPLVTIPSYEDIDTLTTTTEAPTGAPGATGATGPVGATGQQGAPGIDGEVGPQGETGARGEVGATGPAGADGADGADGPQGEAGEKGERGERGPQGEDGETGPAGPQGPAGDVIYVTGSAGNAGESNIEVKPFFATTEMSMGYLIWLIALTVIIIILIIIIAVVARRRRRRAEDEEEPSPINGYEKTRFPSNPNLENVEKSSASWKDYLKDETETTYSNHTLERETQSGKAGTSSFDSPPPQGMDNGGFHFEEQSNPKMMY